MKDKPGYEVELHFFDEVTSTMDIGKEFINKAGKVAIVAKKQTKGRGRYGRKWLSEEGGLYLTLILEQERETAFLSEIASLAIVKTLKDYGINCMIKFPNDIIYNNRKIAGILIEKIDKKYLLGVGINVNNRVEIGVSMKEILYREIEVKEVLEKFLFNFYSIKKSFFSNKKKYLNDWGELLIK